MQVFWKEFVWLREWLLFNTKWAISIYIMAITLTRYIWLDDNDIHFVLVSWIFIVIAHWNNSPWIDMSLQLDTLSCLQANQSLFLFLNAVYLLEKQQMPIL